jgi:hypothetical protein
MVIRSNPVRADSYCLRFRMLQIIIIIIIIIIINIIKTLRKYRFCLL